MRWSSWATSHRRLTARRPNRRDVAAAATRREILRTTRRLFAEHGFAGTSVQRIAEEAGVAVQTIYSSVGSQPTLVLALGDLIDEEADVSRLNAEIAQRLAALGALAPDMTQERAAAVVSMMTSPVSWRQPMR